MEKTKKRKSKLFTLLAAPAFIFLIVLASAAAFHSAAAEEDFFIPEEPATGYQQPTTKTTPSPAPQPRTASASQTCYDGVISVAVEWSEFEGSSFYDIHRLGGSEGLQTFRVWGQSNTVYVDRDVEANTFYTYTISPDPILYQAEGKADITTMSACLHVSVSGPAQVTAGGSGRFSADFAWTVPPSSAASFSLFNVLNNSVVSSVLTPEGSISSTGSRTLPSDSLSFSVSGNYQVCGRMQARTPAGNVFIVNEKTACIPVTVSVTPTVNLYVNGKKEEVVNKGDSATLAWVNSVNFEKCDAASSPTVPGWGDAGNTRKNPKAGSHTQSVTFNVSAGKYGLSIGCNPSSSVTITVEETTVPEAKLNVLSQGASGVAINGSQEVGQKQVPSTSGTTNYTVISTSTISTTLTAPEVAPNGVKFKEWSGCAPASGMDCSVSVALGETKAVTAVYESPPPFVSLTVNGLTRTNNTGSVTTGSVTIGSADAVNFSASSSGADSCTFNGVVASVSGSGSYDPSHSLHPNQNGGSYAYEFSCTNAGGASTVRITASVSDTPPPPGAVTLLINGVKNARILKGQTATVSWTNSRSFSACQSGFTKGHPSLPDITNWVIGAPVDAVAGARPPQSIGPFTVAGSYTLTISCNPSDSANLTVEEPVATLRVNSSGATGVSITQVSGSPSGMGGSTPYTRTPASTIAVRLQAPQTAGGNQFRGWFGCTSTSAPRDCNIEVGLGEDKTITATYEAPPQPDATTLRVRSSNPNSGVSIWAISGNLESGTTGPSEYNIVKRAALSGSLRAVSIAPNGNSFDQWVGCDSASGVDCSVSVSDGGNKIVVAQYKTRPLGEEPPKVSTTAPSGPATFSPGSTHSYSATYEFSGGREWSVSSAEWNMNARFFDDYWERDRKLTDAFGSVAWWLDDSYKKGTLTRSPSTQTVDIAFPDPGNPDFRGLMREKLVGWISNNNYEIIEEFERDGRVWFKFTIFPALELHAMEEGLDIEDFDTSEESVVFTVPVPIYGSGAPLSQGGRVFRGSSLFGAIIGVNDGVDEGYGFNVCSQIYVWFKSGDWYTAQADTKCATVSSKEEGAILKFLKRIIRER